MVDEIKKAINGVWANAFARNSLVLFAGTMISNFLNYIFHVVIGRMVSVQVYGEVESLISLTHLISVPALTLTMMATRYGAHTKADDNPAGSRVIIKELSKKVLRWGIPLFLVALLLAVPVQKFLRLESAWPIVLVWFLMFLGFFSAINNGVLNGWQKFGRFSVISVMGTLIKLIVAIALIRIGWGLNGVMGSLLLSGLSIYLGSIFALKFILTAKEQEKKPQIDFGAMKKYVLPALVAALSIAILGNADMILAKNKLDELTSGNYGALTVISKVIFFVGSIVAGVMFSMASEASHRKGDHGKILSYAIGLSLAITFFGTLFCFLFPKFIINIFFGEKYFPIAPFLGWFGILASGYTFSYLFIQYLLSIGKTRFCWVFLLIALLGSGAIFFFAEGINDILRIAFLTQGAVVVFGLHQVFKGKVVNDQ